ncbi:hypothetical protein HK105_203025 [Polyrhizophydium stewartii]|uniref:Multifunctional fusion protein n=1 Tax=Polyrhizophydium stewartii TaxID=2732419 RepID=A0ABR4ND06_9FUNG
MPAGFAYSGSGAAAESPSVLALVVDVEPLEWAAAGSLERTVDQLLVLVNAHLALQHNNRLAVVAATASRCEIVYPPPASVAAPASAVAAGDPASTADANSPDQHAGEHAAASVDLAAARKPANVYKQFFDVDNHVVRRLRQIVSEDLASSATATDIHKLLGTTPADTQSRILVVSTSPDGPAQYIPIMNCIFAAQRQNTPIDVCRMSKTPSVFLPQAAHITGGIYLHLQNPEHLIQHLIHVFLPDPTTRKLLCVASDDEIDFRASCFCHKRNIDIGYVCSVCLSIFCSVRAECSTAACARTARAATLAFRPPPLRRGLHAEPSPDAFVEQPAASARVWQSSARIGEYAARPLNTVTLEYLLTLGRKRDILGWSAVVSHELPVRLARRVRAIQKLPFIVGVNPWIRSLYELYLESFERISSMPPARTDADIHKLADTVAELTESHKTVIPKLAKGFMECGRYMEPDLAREFLDGMIHSRIGTRVIAEHFLALLSEREGWIGVVNMQVSPASILRSTANYVQEICEYNYGSAPEFELTGHTDARIAYIPVHMEYIFMELLKNAMRATVEFSQRTGRAEHPPVEIAIASSASDLVVRLRDHGGGIPLEHIERVWEYSFTTVPKYADEDDDAGGIFSTQARLSMQQGVGGPIAGLGFGLPMSRIYAKYFGGSLEFRTVHGHGTDLFVRFPNITQIEPSFNI